MKTLPQNIVPFVLRGLPPLNKLDQNMMRKLRKLADLTGWTVEGLMHESILQVVAKEDLETKIIHLPMRRANRSRKIARKF
jgi:predicted transcriptional regulator